MSSDWHAQEPTVGQVAKRMGIAPSTVRWYADDSLLPCERGARNQRRFFSDVLCRVAMMRAAQTVGLTLVEIRQTLDALPSKRPPHGATGTSLRSSSALSSTTAATTSPHYSTR
ncbi:MAG: hypothetical protein BGO26_05740 [Actinobacteria bacterium 69-20]|nr:MerR family transcriptional regulator [Actinomycetota bacterium]OJV27981.1 MAG: hypothetical protein BGO26_05740 [Actinobacteria bacterium 69-20]